MARVLGRMARGQGTMQDSDLMRDVGGNMLFKAFCALADGAVSPVDSSIKYFRAEYEEHLRLGRCPFQPEPEPVGVLEARGDGFARVGMTVPADEVLGCVRRPPS